MANRHRMSKRNSRRSFRSGNKDKTVNTFRTPMRGGFRL